MALNVVKHHSLSSENAYCYSSLLCNLLKVTFKHLTAPLQRFGQFFEDMTTHSIPKCQNQKCCFKKKYNVGMASLHIPEELEDEEKGVCR